MAGSCRLPVTCQDTFTSGLSVRIVNVLFSISRSTVANEVLPMTVN